MDFEQYSDEQRNISARIVSIILSILLPWRFLPMTRQSWPAVVNGMYPLVEQARNESSDLARTFYDAQRAQHNPNADRLDVYRAPYALDWLAEALNPAKDDFLRPGDDNEGAITKTALIVAKEVENGGRRTQLYAVQDDSLVKGWARVATGRETCAFCMMLVSRGPVYLTAESAGFDANDTSAAQILARGDNSEIDELMTRWHPGCDCKVVPVYDRSSWPGRDAYLQAAKFWREHTKGFSGNDALNALRRAIDNGEVDPTSIAAA
jgi:hypothetical protein